MEFSKGKKMLSTLYLIIVTILVAVNGFVLMTQFIAEYDTACHYTL
jgi:hypothetical protein